ncbi:uncharacterized protein [Halyomorpha halys]|uniref:uncharacterized protein n=1 Tax=Halyomorpha halys TaxID=286706 RepID=UPI0006D5278B|nr:uncharacterized protein LOC106689203 [Halyomorpha halys]
MNYKKTCCVCFTTEKVHKFPQGKGSEATERFAVWANFAALENVLCEQKCYALCEKHFEKRMFLNSFSARLVKPAFPTLHPPVYHGPTTMDGSPVCPAIPKSETYDAICKWKEAVILNPNLLHDPAFRRLPFYTPDKIEEKAEETSFPSYLATVTCSFLDSVEDEMEDTIVQTNKRPASPDSPEMETIKVQPVLKTYAGKNSLNKQKNSNNLLNSVSETSPSILDSPDSEDRMMTMFEMRTYSSLKDRWCNNELNDSSILNTSSPLLSSVDRLPSPVMELNSPGDVSLAAITDSPEECYSLSDKDIESSFSSIISSFNVESRNEPDLLSEAINNADICFNEDSPFYSGPKKIMDYDPVLINSVLDDIQSVENLIIYYY